MTSPLPPISTRLHILLLTATALALIATACAPSGSQSIVKMPNVLPKTPPKSLSSVAQSERPTVHQDSDGFLYIAGLKDPKPGDAFVLRHGGPWPETLGERPILGLVRAARVYAKENSPPLVLALPEAFLKGMDPKDSIAEPWTEEAPPQLGKAFARVAEIDGGHVQLSMGFLNGIQPGDRFVALADPTPQNLRINDRLSAVLKVVDVQERTARARILTQGNIRSNTLQKGQWTLFIAPGAEALPLPTKVQLSNVLGGSNETRKTILKHLGAYLKQFKGERITAETIDLDVDPTDPTYGRELAGLELAETPRMLLSTKVVRKRGVPHLILNYTHTGLSITNMIAATPEGGIDIGPVDSLSSRTLAPVFHNLLAASLAHRGQTAEALYLLEIVLRLPGWDGPARWHARDQLAMRWARAGQLRNALWMVHEDVALALKNNDQPALVNAVGTLMPFYEDLGMNDRSLQEARRFYEARKAIGDGLYTTHAKRAWISSLFKAGETDKGREELDAFQNTCKETFAEAFQSNDDPPKLRGTCAHDTFYATISAYWNDRDPQQRPTYIREAADMGELLGDLQMASVRIIQGLELTRAGSFPSARVAYLEAKRLFREQGHAPGVAQVDTLFFNLHMSQNQRQAAYNVAMNSANLSARHQDIRELAGVYRMLSRLYVSVPENDMQVASYVRNAPATMAEALKLQLAMNDLASAAEVFYVSGQFRMRTNPGEADTLLKRAVSLAKRTLRFDIAAMSSFTRAVLARTRGDGEMFQNYVREAQDFARLSGDPQLMKRFFPSGPRSAPRDTL